MGEWITLEPYQIEFADRLALRRRRAAIARKRPAANGAPTDNLRATEIDILGARAEAAGKVYLNPVTWNAFADEVDDLPDLEDWIDVKGRAKDWHALIIQKPKPETWAYLLICAHAHPRYHIVGWLYGHEGKQEKFWSDPAGGRPAYFIPHECLKAPATLRDEVRRRQNLALPGGVEPPTPGVENRRSVR